MWRTAEDQQWLKAQAGVKRSGRVCEDPVKTLSLAWHKDDTPTPEHMVEAADAFLKHMGWEQHQAVYVAHRDTEHKHIHIIVNRVHPETGRTMDDYRERVRAQEWALAYEKEHGKIWCEQREVNAAERAGRTAEPERAASEVKPPQVANDHLPHNVVMLTREHEQAFNAAEQAREQQDRPDREQLKAEQRAEREAFFAGGAKLFKATRHAAYDEVRKEYAPEWRQFYKESAAAEQSAEAWSANAMTRALYFAGRGEWGQARDAFSDRDSVRDAVAAELAEHKSDLKERQTGDLRERQRDACDAL
ncbi:MAG: relaxase/mobilization nuclease domain-containing protein, partial [Hyphomonadaceae bacterium]